MLSTVRSQETKCCKKKAFTGHWLGLFRNCFQCSGWTINVRFSLLVRRLGVGKHWSCYETIQLTPREEYLMWWTAQQVSGNARNRANNPPHYLAPESIPSTSLGSIPVTWSNQQKNLCLVFIRCSSSKLKVSELTISRKTQKALPSNLTR